MDDQVNECLCRTNNFDEDYLLRDILQQLQQSSQMAIRNRATNSYILSFDKSASKRRRSASEMADHIMSERNRRQELSKNFIALSATLPGLKKTEETHVLEEAINYVKELEERVKVLEEDSQISITRSHVYETSILMDPFAQFV